MPVVRVGRRKIPSPVSEPQPRHPQPCHKIAILLYYDMPKTEVIFYQDDAGDCPVLDWLGKLPSRVEAKARVRIELLGEYGHELRRPEADILRDGIHELRWRYQSVNYRILYFFHGRSAVVLSHGLTKEDVVPPKEIHRALSHKRIFEANPETHTYKEE